MAAELAFGPSSALTERILCVSDPMIAEAVEAGGIAVESDPVRAAAALRAVMAGSTRPSDYVASSAGSAPAHGKSLRWTGSESTHLMATPS